MMVHPTCKFYVPQLKRQQSGLAIMSTL